MTFTAGEYQVTSPVPTGLFHHTPRFTEAWRHPTLRANDCMGRLRRTLFWVGWIALITTPLIWLKVYYDMGRNDTLVRVDE